LKTLYRVFYFTTLTILFSLGFYKNQWKAASMFDVQYRRDISEAFIMGRLVKSHQDGIFSAGGLLGMGDVDEGNFNSSTLKNQYRKYDKGTDFYKYWLYKSQPGFQGIAYSLADAWTDFAPSTNLFLFRASISIVLSLILAGVCLWFLLEAGWMASISAALYILFSTKLAIFGGNLFWSLWSFYLPLLVIAFVLRRAGGRVGATLTFRFAVLVFVLSFIKILFSGFEFITTALLLGTVPLVYYAVLKGWEFKLFIRSMVIALVALAASVLAGLIVLFVQIRMAVGNNQDAFAHIIYSLKNRTYEHDALAGGVTDSSQGMLGRIFLVIEHNLNGYAFSFSNHFSVSSGVLKDLLDGRYLFLVLLFILVTVIVIALNKNNDHRVGLALVAACWYSALAPLSWYVIFRDHAYGHRMLDYLVLEMPFTLFGFALAGYAVSALSRLWQRQSRFFPNESSV
jgi:hypothetical protein